MSSAPRLAPSRVNWTPATPMLSAAVALTGVVPVTVAPAAGALTETVGGVMSLLTVTLTGAEVVVLPGRVAGDRAQGVGAVPAVVVFQRDRVGGGGVLGSEVRAVEGELDPGDPDVVGGGRVDGRSCRPRWRHRPGALTLTVGGVVSGTGLATVTLTAVEVVVLPAASRAIARRVWVPLVAVVVFQLTE